MISAIDSPRPDFVEVLVQCQRNGKSYNEPQEYSGNYENTNKKSTTAASEIAFVGREEAVKAVGESPPSCTSPESEA